MGATTLRQPGRRRQDRLTAGVAALMVAAGVATVALTLALVVRLHVPLPFWDQWQTVAELRAYADGAFGWSDLAQQHNEHRLLFPRLFFFADELAFGLSGWSDLAATLMLQLATAALLLAPMRRVVVSTARRVLLSGFVLLMLFTLRQEQNFSNGFQLQFVGVFTAAAAAAVAYAGALDRLADGGGRRSWPGFALAALACCVSTYTMANGVLAGFVLAGAALMRRAAWRVPAITLLLSSGLAALFFHRYLPGQSSYPADQILPHAWAYPRYFTAYLGNPLGSGLRTTQALGSAGVLLAGAAVWRVATGRSRDRASVAWVTVAGFVLASAAAVTWGRVTLGTQQAFESRYATPALIFWSAIILFWFPVAFRARPRWTALAAASASALAGLMALLSIAAIVFEATAWPDMAAQSTALRAVSDSLMAGLLDEEVVEGYENTSSDRIRALVPFLRDHRLAAFASPESAVLGHPPAALAPTAPREDCDGTVAARSDPALGEGGVKAEGTAWDHAARGPVRRIVLVGGAGTIAGYGSASRPGMTKRLWSGYARAAVGERVLAYALLADGRLCPIGDAPVALLGPLPAP